MIRKIIPVVLGLMLICGVVLYGAIKTSYDIDVPVEKNAGGNSTFNLKQHINHLSSSEINDQFPYNTYLDAVNLNQIKRIIQDIELIDSIFPNQQEKTRSIFEQLLTTKLEERIRPSLEVANIDSLIIMAQWAERFHFYKDIESPNTQLYKIVYRYWFNLISNQVSQYSERDNSIKYNFKFKYLVGLIQSKKYAPSISNTKGEKVLLYLTEGKYAYLFNRFWNGSSWATKTGVFLIVAYFIFSAYCVLKVIFTKK